MEEEHPVESILQAQAELCKDYESQSVKLKDRFLEKGYTIQNVKKAYLNYLGKFSQPEEPSNTSGESYDTEQRNMVAFITQFNNQHLSIKQII